MINPAYFRCVLAPKPNRAPFICERCGERSAWNQRRDGRDAHGERISICRRCKGH